MNSLDSVHEKPDFEAVYDVWYDRVYKYAFAILLNREDAEDVTADTFIAAYLNYDHYDPDRASAGTWLTRIAHNFAVNVLRSASRTRRSELPRLSEVPCAGDLADQAASSDVMLRLYDRLRPDERELLNLRYVMGLRDKEIGALLELSENTVNKRRQRLLVKCRTILNGFEKDI